MPAYQAPEPDAMMQRARVAANKIATRLAQLGLPSAVHITEWVGNRLSPASGGDFHTSQPEDLELRLSQERILRVKPAHWELFPGEVVRETVGVTDAPKDIP